MPPEPVRCTCTKRFQTNNAMLQHQRDSPRHIAAASQAPEQTRDLNQLVQRLSLQDQEADHDFISFPNSEATVTSPAVNPDLRISEPVMAGEEKLFIAEGTTKKTKKKNKKRRRGEVGRGRGSSYSSENVDMLGGQDWGLCDKDCGWCGRCAAGAWY